MPTLLGRHLATTRSLVVQTAIVAGGAAVGYFGGGALAELAARNESGAILKRWVTLILGGVAQKVGTGWIARIQARFRSPSDALRRRDLLRLVGTSIQSVLVDCADKQRALDPSKTRLYQLLGTAAFTRWEDVASCPAVAGISADAVTALDEDHLAPLLRAATGEAVEVLADDTWMALLRDFAATAKIEIPDNDLATLAARLRTHFARAVCKNFTDDFVNGGRAFAGLLLQLLNVMSADITGASSQLEILRAWLEADTADAGARHFRLTQRLQDLKDGIQRLHDRDAMLGPYLERLWAGLAERASQELAVLNADLARRVSDEIRQSPPRVPSLQLPLDTRSPRREDAHAGRFSPRNQRISFIGREQELATLLDWLTPTRPSVPSVRVLTGDAGVGKTRLAMELASRAREAGWHAGFLDLGGLNEFLERRTRDWAWEIPTLAVVDDAAVLASPLKQLLVRLDERSDYSERPPLRVLLIDRFGPDEAPWWFQTIGRRQGQLGAWYPEGEPDMRLHGLTTSRALRPFLRASLVAALGGAPTAADWRRARRLLKRLHAPADLGRPPTPLVVQLACELGASPPTGGVDLDRVLRNWRYRELERLDQILRDRGLGGQDSPIDLIIACITWIQRGVDRVELEHIAALACSALSVDPLPAEPMRLALGDMLGAVDRRFGPLQPDLLGEYWLVEALESISIDARKSLVLGVLPMEPAVVTSFLARASLDFPRQSSAASLLRILGEPGILAPDLLAQATCAIDLLPTDSVQLRAPLAGLSSRRAEQSAFASRGEPVAEHARHLVDEADRLAVLGRYDEALRSSKEAIRIYRSLADRGPRGGFEGAS